MAFEQFEIDDYRLDLDDTPPASHMEKREAKAAQTSNQRLGVVNSAAIAHKFYKDRVRFNTLSEQVEILEAGEWVTYDKQQLGRAYLAVSRHTGENADKTITKDTIEELATANRFDPVLEYFNGLRTAEPDTYKFENLITWAFGQSSKHGDEIMRLFLVAAVARVFKPGTYYRHVPVIAGPYNVGKSFLTQLSPFKPAQPSSHEWQVRRGQISFSGTKNHILELG